MGTRDVQTPTSPTTVPSSTPILRPLALERKYEDYCDAFVDEFGEEAATRIPSFQSFSASIIQRWWRRLHRFPSPSKGPYTPPPTTFTYPSQMDDRRDTASTRSGDREKIKITDPFEAAVVIQRAWRRHIDVQVYKYYRDLISFRSRGDPALMLKCINPREAELLDGASGIHIKFRLAGEKFPPNIYYKIFTHRPVVDLCSCSPKDYTVAALKQPPAKHIHNKGHIIQQDNREGWYRRWENNGWRLVSDRLLKRVDEDPIVYSSAQQKSKFHHVKLVRKDEVERKRKHRKIEWMRKMYKEGMLRAKAGHNKNTVNVIDSAAKGLVAATDDQGLDAVEEWEVDELLEWTNGLNFDQYLNNWKEIATSGKSEKIMAEGSLIDDDPFSVSFSR